MKRPFDKPVTTYTQQVALLQKRGMSIGDVAKAELCLQHINYYRLSAYWLPFQVNATNHEFKLGTCFDDVLNSYNFDRELRLLVLDSIERIEVSVRSQWAYQVGYLHGSHAHLDCQLFDRHQWQKNLNDLTKEVNRSKEIFIEHLRNTYSEELPPVWAVCEVMSLGLLSRWYSSLKPQQTRKAIANAYGLSDVVLKSWLQNLNLVRNICAHHSRLWNRKLTVTPTLPRSGEVIKVVQFVPNSRKLYNTLVIILLFMDKIVPSYSWRSCFRELIAKYSISVDAMGFPQNWQQQAIWQAATS
jgi:abortive infection bacteriophage resistance protein